MITSRFLLSQNKGQARRLCGRKGTESYRSKRGDKTLTLDEEKTNTVKRVLELRDAKPDALLQKIADILNVEGLYYERKANRSYLCK